MAERSSSSQARRHEPVLRALAAGAALAVLWAVTSLLAGAHHELRDTRAAGAASAGRVAMERGAAQEALRPLRDAVALQPDVAAHRLALGQALLALGRHDEALTYLTAVVSRDPVSGEANLAVARAHRAAGHPDRAERSYYRAVYGQWRAGADPTRVQTRLELIALLQDTADAARVRTELLRLAADFPGDLGLHLHIGQSLTSLGFPADASRVFEDAITRFAAPGSAYAGLAVARFQAGDYPAALTAATTALQADAADTQAAAVRRRANAALALDPTLPRLSVAERTTRWRRLLAQARARLATCTAGRPSETSAQLMEFAATALSRRATPDLAMNAGAALARAVAQDCPAPPDALSADPPPFDDALLLVARRIASLEPAR